MTLWYVPGQGIVDDQAEDIPEYGELALPDGSKITWGVPGIARVPEYQLPAQFGTQRFQWRPDAATQEWAPGLSEYAVGYIPQLIDWGEAARAGTLADFEREQYDTMRQQALAIPTRDWTQLQAGYPGEEGDWSHYLTPSSPDAGAIMLQLDERIRSGQATGQERQLFDTFLAQMRDQDWRASVPQPSDAFSPLGDQFFQALNALTMAVGGAGSFGAFGAAGAAGAGAGAGGSILGVPTSTLGTIGTVGGYGAQGAGMLGTALKQPWLTRLAGALGAASGLAGGAAGLGNLAASGVQNVSDVGRLLQSTGRVTGALGAIPGADPLRQAGRYLGLAGQVGRAGGGAGELFQAAQDVQAGATQGWGDAGTGGAMSEWDYSNDWGRETPYDNWSWDAGASPDGGWDYSNDWGRETPYDNWSSGSGATDGGWLSSVLGTLGSVGSFLGKNAGWLGPAVSGLTGLGAGALGAQASRDAAGAQSDALNRALELQTAQWLQQQANQAPWLAAGQQALPQLQQLAGQGQPTLGQLAPIRGADYAMPGVMPGWNPAVFQGPAPLDAAAYRYTPGQGPRAGDYRYTPGAVPTVRGAELLANDPGVQFRQEEARKALEASAAARGGLLSGSTLAALQRQGQDLASQEYGNAWQRAAQQAQMREQWAQTASQLGFGQAQAEAAFREQLAQQAGAQNWQQALQGQQTAFQQGLQGRQQTVGEFQNWFDTWYNRGLQQHQLQYARDWQEREAANQRLMDLYNAQRQGLGTQWNQLAGLAGIGQTAVGQLGTGGQNQANAMANLLQTLGAGQAQGQLSQGNAWTNALSNVGNAAQGAFGNMNFQNQLTSLLANLNR